MCRRLLGFHCLQWLIEELDLVRRRLLMLMDLNLRLLKLPKLLEPLGLSELLLLPLLSLLRLMIRILKCLNYSRKSIKRSIQ